MMIVKECPTCGGNKVEIRKTLTNGIADENSVYILCLNCGTGVGNFPTEEKAINGWNKLGEVLAMKDLEKYEVKKWEN